MLTDELIDNAADIPGIELQALLDYKYPGVLNLNSPFLSPSQPCTMQELQIA